MLFSGLIVIKDYNIRWKNSWAYIQASIIDQPRIDYDFEEKLKLLQADEREEASIIMNKNASFILSGMRPVQTEKKEEEHPDIPLVELLQ